MNTGYDAHDAYPKDDYYLTQPTTLPPGTASNVNFSGTRMSFPQYIGLFLKINFYLNQLCHSLSVA